jgi:hypothetical protein
MPIESDSNRIQKKYYSMLYHRILKGEGGIIPDVVTATNPPFTEEAMLKITSGQWMDEVVFFYYIKNYAVMSKYSSARQLEAAFKTPDALLDRLKIRLDLIYPNAIYELWQNPYALDFIRLHLKAKMIQLIFGDNEYYQFLNNQDADVQKAETIINRPSYLQIIQGEAA